MTDAPPKIESMKQLLSKLFVVALLVTPFLGSEAHACKCEAGYKPAWNFIGQRCVRSATKLNSKGQPVLKDGTVVLTPDLKGKNNTPLIGSKICIGNPNAKRVY